MHLRGLYGAQEETAIISLYSINDWFLQRNWVCLLRGTDWVFKCNSG